MKEKAELALASSKWGDAASGAVKGLSEILSGTVEGVVDVLASPITGLIGVYNKTKESLGETADASAINTISVEPHPQYTSPLNRIALQSIDIAEDTDLISQKLGSLSANLTLKLSELSDKLSDIIEVMGATASNSPGPVSFFRGADIEA